MKKYAYLVLASITIVGFQNCAPNKFTSVEMASLSKADPLAAGTEDPVTILDPVSGPNIPPMNDPGSTTPVVPTPPPAASATPGQGQPSTPVTPPVVPTATPRPGVVASPTPMACTPVAMQSLSALMIQQLPQTVTAIATNCIDSVTPTMQDSLPTDPARMLRFKNTCGNRQCQNMGFASGRVTEVNGNSAMLECRHAKVPAGYSNPCASLVTGSAAPLQNFSLSQAVVQNECIDSANPTFASNDPNLNSASMSRFFLVCGSRSCVSRGFADGRVVESYGGQVTLQCYKDLLGVFKNLNAAVSDIANNCIDAAVKTLAANLPTAGGSAQERFMSTCGNRYCAKLGYRAGEVKEISNSTATLRCIQ